MLQCRLEPVDSPAPSVIIEVSDPTAVLQVFYAGQHHNLLPGELIKLKPKFFPELLLWCRNGWHRLLVLDRWSADHGWSNIWSQ